MTREEIEHRIEEIRNGNYRPGRGELARLIALVGGPDRESSNERTRGMRKKREAKRRDEAQANFHEWKSGILKRGPKPDPHREQAVECLTVRVTKRERRALSRQHDRLCRDSSPSTFIRMVLCQWLEAQEPEEGTLFVFDPEHCHWRTLKRDGVRGGLEARSADSPRP